MNALKEWAILNICGPPPVINVGKFRNTDSSLQLLKTLATLLLKKQNCNPPKTWIHVMKLQEIN